MRFLVLITLASIYAAADPKPVSHDLSIPELVAYLPTEDHSPQVFLFRADSQPSVIIFDKGWDPQTSRSHTLAG
ncbi:hypothetical protein VCV18_000089 [Metarhizium anisopliae]